MGHELGEAGSLCLGESAVEYHSGFISASKRVAIKDQDWKCAYIEEKVGLGVGLSHDGA